MRSLVVAATLCATAFAQTALPACAQSCFATGISQSGGCSASDETCLCNSVSFGEAIKSCVTSSCSSSDAQTALSYFIAFCQAVLPATSSALASVSSSIAPPAPSTVSSITTTPSSQVSVASSVPQSVVSSASSEVSSVLSAISSSTTSASSQVVSTTQSVPTTLSTQVSSNTAAGSVQTPAASNDSSQGKSNSGKYAGIGVGAGLGCAILVGALIIWFLLKRRRSAGASQKVARDQPRSDGDGGGDKFKVATEVLSVSSDGASKEKNQHSSDRSAQELQGNRQFAGDETTRRNAEELEATRRYVEELEAKQRAHELQAAKQRVQELEAQQRMYELEAQQRYEMEHTRDRYAMLGNGGNDTLPPRYQNARAPRELP